jgi:hypothetical protein
VTSLAINGSHWPSLALTGRQLLLTATQVKVTLRSTVTRPVSLDVTVILGLKTKFLLLSDGCGFVDVGRPP